MKNRRSFLSPRSRAGWNRLTEIRSYLALVFSRSSIIEPAIFFFFFFLHCNRIQLSLKLDQSSEWVVASRCDFLFIFIFIIQETVSSRCDRERRARSVRRPSRVRTLRPSDRHRQAETGEMFKLAEWWRSSHPKSHKPTRQRFEKN